MGKKVFLDDDWKFTEQFEPELLKDTYEGTLQNVRIPHTCKEVPLHYFDESLYQMECGYRRLLQAPEEWQGKRIVLTFDGVAHACRVYLNGNQLASHACGYTAFSVELTGKLRIGEKNILAVCVDSRESLNIPPFGFVIDYMTFGGIYRDVYLQIYEEDYLEDVFISTRQGKEFSVRSVVRINAAGAEKTQECGEGNAADQSSPADSVETVQKTYMIRQWIRLKGDTKYCLLGEKEIRKKNTQLVFRADQAEGIGRIMLWDVEHPALYQLKTELFSEGRLLDEREDTFGFRRMRFTKDGFYLNGRKLKIRGLNRHQSYPYIGYAAPKSLQVADADILKHELGVNAVRTSHYPQSHYFLDRCDELGLLVFTEMPGWQHIGDAAWKDQALLNLADMIRQYRNHPSIMIWGVRINESMDDDAFYQRTNEIAHHLDPTRQTGGVRAIKKSHLFEDVYTYNEFVHEGNNKGCEPKRNVTSDMEKGYLITEHNGHMFPTKSYDCEDHRVSHALRHANVIEAVGEQKDIAGCFGWCMFDYNTHKDFGSGDRVCYHGVMDMFRNPKLAAAVYASQQDEEPVLVCSSAMDIGEHPGCNRGQIWLFTNADSVRMYKNGEFIHEYSSEDGPYQHMPHSPIIVDDFVGTMLETKEHMEARQARDVKKLLNQVARYGLNKLPIDAKLTAAKLIAVDHMNFEQAAELYNKYIGDWGGTSTAYSFEAIRGGQVVKTLEKQPMHSLKLFCRADHRTLREDQTYDMAMIRMEMQDEYGNLMSFCNDPVILEAQGDIELVGPSVISFQGGMTGTYVRTVGKAGSGKLIIKAPGCEETEIGFSVEI